jgi:hypothetical protein
VGHFVGSLLKALMPAEEGLNVVVQNVVRTTEYWLNLLNVSGNYAKGLRIAYGEALILVRNTSIARRV